jgi:maleate cis-trans isomerase
LLTRETVPAYKAKALELAREFAKDDLDAVVYGCTAAGFIYGPSGDAELAAQLADITGQPVITTARAMVEVLEHSGASDVAVVTPYGDVVNQQLIAFLAESDIRVTKLRTFNASSVEELGRITASQVAGLARNTVTPDSDALFIACSQLPTHAIVGALQSELMRPVWSSIQASAWQTKERLS